MTKKNLRMRFVVYFFIIMLSASLIASVFPYMYVSRRMEKTLEVNQNEIAEKLIGLYEDENGNIIDSTSGTSYEVYSVHRISHDHPIIKEHLGALDAGEIVVDNHWLLPTVSTYFSIGGNYYEISLFPNTTIMWQLYTVLMASVLAAIVLGTLIASFAGKRFLRPIRELCSATEEVAKGNFSVRVSVPDNMEMGKLVTNFNKMTRDLGSTETLQREFISNVSHEFKTPLASIKGFADLLRYGEVSDEERREYAEIISDESKRLSRLATSILRLSKLENTDTPPECKPYDVAEQIRRTILTLEPQWSGKGIAMDVTLTDVEFCGSEELLGEVWMNLLTNAIKFSPEGGRIYVRLEDGLDDIIVEVEDEGCGMTAEVKKRIFDKFYQGDRSHSGEGNGLGLSMVRRIIELSRGRIEVESIEGEGSLFRVILPRDGC
ncbi:MAG: HAMP domain-containing histidine kinase [Clostridia bacterium]|nr:HAMP domain-containing histidine kinase [Clostridia bacterium]MBQ9993100.1 HAMP domain-containing histidine kinase [Clostridia bacterium]